MSVRFRRGLVLALIGLGCVAGVARGQGSMGGSGFFGRVRDCNTTAAVNQTASTTVITGTAGSRIYVCGILLVSDTAQNISIVEGTGTLCATGITAMIGGTTASVSLAAQAGFSTVGAFAWIRTAASNNLCILQSAGGNVSGAVTYRVAP